jgi:hypothetical protein
VKLDRYLGVVEMGPRFACVLLLIRVSPKMPFT